MKTVAAVFESLLQAEQVARDLQGIGIPPADINVIAGNEANQHNEYLEKAKQESTGTGAAAASGASFGGGVGILAGLAALIIPGVGPIIAGGALATVLTGLGIGAAGGALVGAFRNLGMSHDEAGLYEEAVRRGSVVVAAHVNDPMEAETMRIMDEHGARDLREDIAGWRAKGWTHPYPAQSEMKSHEMPEVRSRSYPYER